MFFVLKNCRFLQNYSIDMGDVDTSATIDDDKNN